MKRFFSRFVGTCLLTALLGPTTQAGLLGITPDFPTLAYDSTGVTNYVASTGELTVTAQSTFVRFLPATPPQVVLGTPAERVVAVRVFVDSTGQLISGAPGDDLVVMGTVSDGLGNVYSGVLLTGEVVGFGYAESGATDQLDFRFQLTGGELAPLYGARDIGVTVTVEMSTFNNDFTADFNGGAKGNIGPLDAVCDLEVLAEVCIAPPPAPPVTRDDCRGRVTRMTLRYTGADCSATQHSQTPSRVSCNGDAAMSPQVRIRATDKSNPNDSTARVWFDGFVGLGDSFTLSAASAGAAELRADTWVFMYSVGACPQLLQTVKFHTSCSQPLNLGDQFGAVQVVGLRTTQGGEVVLPVHPEPPAQECLPFIPLPAGDNCRGRVRRLELQYTGDSCSATLHTQAADKVSCAGDPAGAALVRIRVSDKSGPSDSSAKIWFNGVVALGSIFTAQASAGGANELGTNTWVHVFTNDGSILLQTVKFHTSCSQPLNVGNQFGSIVVVGMDTTQGGSVQLGNDVTLTYTIINHSTVPVSNVVVSDNFGEVPGSPIESILAGESAVLTRTIRLFDETDTVVSVMADLGPNVVCEANTVVTVDGEEPPPPPPPPAGDDGCTPGYWKTHLHRWPAAYPPSASFNSTFGVAAFSPDITLNDAIRRTGGGVNALARHATAALLNAAHPDVEYALSVAQVIELVQSAFAPGGSVESVKNALEGFNEAGCPLDGRRCAQPPRGGPGGGRHGCGRPHGGRHHRRC